MSPTLLFIISVHVGHVESVSCLDRYIEKLGGSGALGSLTDHCVVTLITLMKMDEKQSCQQQGSVSQSVS